MITIKDAQEMLCTIQEKSDSLADALKNVGFNDHQLGELIHTFKVLNFAGMVVDGKEVESKQISKGVQYILTDAIILGVLLGAYGAVIPEGITVQ